MEELIRLDRELFEKINTVWTSAWADRFFPFVTDLYKSPIAGLILVVLLGVWVWREKLYAMKWIVALVLSVALSDLVAYRVVKPLVHRARPPAAAVAIVVRGEVHTGNSFPSNHATNTFAAAFALSGGLPLLTVPLFFLAALVAYSRVYVGAHFPLDVLGGAALGVLIAALVRIALRNWLKRPKNAEDSSLVQSSDPLSSSADARKESAPGT